MLLILLLLTLFCGNCYASDYLASVGKSTSDLVVERKNEIMFEKQMEWMKYKYDKLHEYRMKKAEHMGKNK